MNQRQTQRLNAIISAFTANIKSFTDDLSASYDEKDNAIAKQLQRESEMLKDNDALRSRIEELNKLNWKQEETIAEQDSKIHALEAENAELKEKLNKAPKLSVFGKYRQHEEKPVKEPKNGFRIKED